MNLQKFKYLIFKRFKQRENQENRSLQLLMPHARKEVIENERLHDEAE